jgi:hypothetical protein
MSFIEINTKKQFKLHIHTTVPSAEIKERVKPIFIYFSSCENNELKSNLGISDRLFKKHGRWRSETAKDGYVKDSLPDRLSASKNLGL